MFRSALGRPGFGAGCHGFGAGHRVKVTTQADKAQPMYGGAKPMTYTQTAQPTDRGLVTETIAALRGGRQGARRQGLQRHVPGEHAVASLTGEGTVPARA